MPVGFEFRIRHVLCQLEWLGVDPKAEMRSLHQSFHRMLLQFPTRNELVLRAEFSRRTCHNDACQHIHLHPFPRF